MSFRPDLQERRDRIGTQLAGVAAALPSATGAQRRQLLRRGTSLAQRAQRLDGHLDQFTRAQRVAEEILIPKQRTAREARFLDVQSKLLRGQPASPARASAHRNYAQLAGLVGKTPGEYRAGSAQEKLRARARIDRGLAQRVKDQREVRRPAVRATPGAATEARSDDTRTVAPGRADGTGTSTRRRARMTGAALRRRAPGSSR